ncbi:hypothetical protein [Sinorhizobium meliloti]|uniref:hypothetical protein n=1 Tax=Rhizobium meliloti TaxID=382 RepID=UPI001F478181|nr:hypothetical protein [Sinorhizobium meliloti]
MSESVYSRYESNASRLTVGRLIRPCEVLGATPKEIFAPAAPHLSGQTEANAHLPMAAIKSDEETFEVFSLLNRPGKTRKSGHGDYGAGSTAPILSRTADPMRG